MSEALGALRVGEPHATLAYEPTSDHLERAKQILEAARLALALREGVGVRHFCHTFACAHAVQAARTAKRCGRGVKLAQMKAAAAAAVNSEFAELVFDELVEDLVLEVCFPLHRAHSTRAVCLNCGGVDSAGCDGWEVPPVGSDEYERKLIDAMQRRVGELADEVVSREPGLDVFGTKPRTVAIDNFKCSHCGKKVAANRYAKHLEGCMLGGGRASARIADSGKDPSPLAKRSKQADARASPQNLFAAVESFEDVFDPSLIV